MTARLPVFGLLLLTMMMGGCYKRTPLAATTPATATRLVATLTDSGTVAMGNALGPGALEVEGVVRKADENQWTIELLRVDHRDQRSISWNHEPVSFPRGALTNPVVIVFDKRRSWLAAGGIAVGAFLLARAFDLIGSDEDKSEVPPPQESVVPVVPSGGK